MNPPSNKALQLPSHSEFQSVVPSGSERKLLEQNTAALSQLNVDPLDSSKKVGR